MSHGIFSIETIKKKGLAQASKVKKGYRLRSINGIEISSMKSTADNNFSSFRELYQLLSKAEIIDVNNINEMNRIKKEMSAINIKENFLIYENYPYEGYYLTKPLASGTVLQFVDNSSQGKTVEITIP